MYLFSRSATLNSANVSLFTLQVHIHHPEAFPEVAQEGMIMNKGTVNYVAVKATVTET